MTTYLYAEDRDASLPANFITGEQHSVVYDAENDFHYFIPKHAPFYAKDFRIREVTGSGQVPIVEGSGYHFGAEFSTASMSTGRALYGAVVLPFLSKDTVFEIDYRTLGGTYTLDEAALTAAVANVIKNPRGLSWEQVANTPGMVSPTDHYWRWNSVVGLESLVASIVGVGNTIENKAAAGSANLVNVQDLSKFNFGLDQVQNYGMASLLEAVAGQRGDALLSPLTLFAVLDNLNVLRMKTILAQMEAHVKEHGNAHRMAAADINLDQVPNLPLATDDDIIRNRTVDKLMTLRQVQLWNKLHGGSSTPEQTFAPLNAKLQSYCREPDRYMLRANGTGGTYEELEKANDPTCGYRETIKIYHPPKGDELTSYCDNGNLMVLIATGTGEATSTLKEVGSATCKVPGSTPPAGQVLAVVCDKGTLRRTIANGAGGVVLDEKLNAEECLQTSIPEKDKFIRYECDNETHNRILVQTDGLGGEKKSIFEVNVKECGYIAPTTPPTQTYPPNGSKAGNSCGTGTDQFTYYELRHNGVGGTYPVEIERNSRSCGYNGTPVTTAPTPSPTSAPRVGSVQFSTTHTMIYVGDTEVITVRLFNWTPNTEYNVETFGNSQDWGSPFERMLGARQVRTDALGNAVLYIEAKEEGVVPVGTYLSWFAVNGVKSNVITRRFLGRRS